MKIKKAIIPLAGKGTRFLPITKAIPKHMLPLVDKPAIHYLVDELLEAGIEEIIFIINEEDKLTEKYFTQDKLLEEYLIERNKQEGLKKLSSIPNNFKMHFLVQEKQNGSGDAILLARDYIEDEPFLVLYGDDIIIGNNACLELIKVYEQTNKMVIGVEAVTFNEAKRYGIVKWKTDLTNNYAELNNIMQQASNSNGKQYSFVGRVLLTKGIFNYLEQTKKVNSELGLSYAIENMLKEETIYGCLLSGNRYDIGNKEGYFKVIKEIISEENINEEN